jgi:hypothetical protein
MLLFQPSNVCVCVCARVRASTPDNRRILQILQRAEIPESRKLVVVGDSEQSRARREDSKWQVNTFTNRATAA